MHIQTLRLSEFRRFVQTFELAGLAPGLNLITGPNEAGKSTLAAAVRAAFLERYRTGTVTDFAPHGVTGARPTVDVDFQVQGREYRLRKTFLNRARCELQVENGERLEGEAAEEALAQLLGFALPGRGQSRPEHAGVPGLLWIRQGDSADQAPVQHAGTHVRDALARLSGELANEESDRVLTRAQEERGLLLDLRGKPRGVYRETEEALAGARADVQRLREARAALDAAVDRLATLRRAHGQDEEEKPWLVFEAQAADARAREQAASQEKAQVDGLLREQRQLDEQIALLLEQVRRDHEDDEERVRLAAQAERAREDVEAAAAVSHTAETARDAAAAALATARQRQEAARADAERRDVDLMLARETDEVARLARAVAEAGRLAQRRAELAEALTHLRMAPADLDGLRAVSAELDTLAAQQSAAATRLQFALGSDVVVLDDAQLPAEGERWITQPAELRLAGGGWLRIVPGGADLASLGDAQTQAEARRQRLLRDIGEASLPDAQRRFERLQAAQRDLQAVERELAIHAPRGLPTLESTLAEGQAQCERLRVRRDGLAPVDPLDPAMAGVDPRALVSELQWAQQAAEQAESALTAARQRQQKAALQAEQLLSRGAALTERDRDPAVREARADRERRLTEARAQRSERERGIVAAQARLADHRPDLLAQDIARFEGSARIARDAFQARQRDMLLLQGRLDEAGAQGLGESLAQAEAQAERLGRRVDGLAARAAALELLLGLLRERRDAATQRLLAPLTQRLAHYAGMLFPQARVAVDDGFVPHSLRRGDVDGAIETLSHGTQEQLGILARLAYADVLREAGRPTLVILDDALVHSDAERLGWMKRALFDAASRHQILIFSCHAAAWRDLGVQARVLGSDGPLTRP